MCQLDSQICGKEKSAHRLVANRVELSASVLDTLEISFAFLRSAGHQVEQDTDAREKTRQEGPGRNAHG